tara:strand:+ start:311 stop:1681 length:1371 start_codon:yes stop_codon:yes gene_type:complete
MLDYKTLRDSRIVNKFIAGLNGKDGLRGKQGLKGERGEQGNRGEKGDQGEKGIQGDRGIRGEKGDKGDRGIRGEKGDRGDRGEKGDCGENGKDGQSFIYMGEYNNQKNYKPNNIISYDNNLYIAKENIIDEDPNLEKKWKLFMGRGFKFEGLWEKNKNYKINNAVIDKINMGLYISTKNDPHKNINPSANKNSWKVLFLSEWINIKKELKLFEENKKDLESLISLTNNKLLVRNKGQWVQNDRYFTNDIIKYNNNIYIASNPIKSSKIPSDDMNWILLIETPTTTHNALFFGVLKSYTLDNLLKYKIEQVFYKIPINYVQNNNSQCYNFKEDSVNIIKEGDYRITYNIVYHGSIYDFTSGITIKDALSEQEQKDNYEFISFSLNKDKNRQSNDTIPDNYYETMENDNINYINHSFIIPIKKSEYNLSLGIKFNKRNVNKTIFIHPIKTFLTIEKIN